MQFLDLKMEAKSLNENGEISGYASVFNVIDAHNDLIIKGAFSKAVEAFNAGKSPKLLWQHDANLPIGIIEEMLEDEHGLFIKCRLLMEVEKAREAYALLKNQAINGFSIGYRISDSYVCNGVKHLCDIELLEISIVTFPACKEATVNNVKSENNNNDKDNNKSNNNNSNNNSNNNNKSNEDNINKANNTNNNFELNFNEKNDRRNNMNNFNYNDNNNNNNNNNSYNNRSDGNQNFSKNNGQKSLPLSRANGLSFSDYGDYNSSYNKSNFLNYIRTGSEDFFRKSLSSANDETGGFLLPGALIEQVNNRMQFISTMRRISSVMTISSGSIDLLVDSKNPDAGWIGDNEDRDETDTPEIQKIKIPVHEVYAKPKANQRLLDDSQIDIEEWLLSKISEKIAMLENNAFINGDGENKPKGFLKYTMVTDPENIEIGKLQCFKSGMNGDFVGDTEATNLLIDMSYSIKPIYAKNAVWIMSRSALARIRKLRKNNGTCIWEPAISEASPSTLLGYPVYVDDDMPALQKNSASASVAFGDFKAGYQIVDRQGLKILRDPYTSKPFVEFYISKRTGGGVVDFDAIKVLKFEQF